MFIKGKIFANIQKVNVIHLLKYCLFIIEKYDKYVETAFRVCLKHVSLNVNWFVYLRLLNVCFFWHQQCFISNIYKTMLMSDENLAAFLICIYNDYICIKNQAWLFTWRNFFFQSWVEFSVSTKFNISCSFKKWAKYSIHEANFYD